jgi:ABC-type polysaccharide/polyol phosphate export permease
MSATPAPIRVYDSADRVTPIVGQLRIVWEHRQLLRLLPVRDVALKYKRSVLGVWWTLLTPVFTMLCMWLVFSKLFRFSTPGQPYSVYLLSGVVVISFFQLAVAAVGASTVVNSEVLTKVYAPPQLFALAAAAAAGVTFIASLVPLAILQLILGVGIPWTIVLVPLPTIALLGLIAGCGLIVAAAAVRYYDALDLTRIGLTVAGYLSPVFYPTSILSARALTILKFNPLFHFLVVFRSILLGQPPAPWTSWVIVAATGIGGFIGGSWVFQKSWRRAATML